MKEGPIETTVIKYTCTGCIFLVTKDWRFECENDDIDSGTEAKCSKLGRNIASYWHDNNSSPSWCPFLIGNCNANS